jgi:hypothetical protein
MQPVSERQLSLVVAGDSCKCRLDGSVTMSFGCRADSLREVLTGPHAQGNVAGSGKLSEEQLSDLLEYLKSL